MLETNENLAYPLNRRNPKISFFALVTPETFMQEPYRHTRLYGWLMDRYRRDPKTLSEDMPYRAEQDWTDFDKRLGWVSWESCNTVLPDSCPWL